MASFIDFLRNTGNAIQQNIGDPYAKALTRAARTGNYNPFDIVANAAMNRKASEIVTRDEARTRAREDYFSRLPEERGNLRSGSYRYQDANGNWYNDQVTSEELDEYYKTKNSKEKPKEKTKENPDDYIEFTYNPGDAFGQKILDLGIATNNGLWGDNGDVAYYTQQLIDGGYLDGNGNVKLGVPIRLKKRK